MDGHFVNNLLFGPDIIKSLRKYTKKAFQIHLMVNNPEQIIEQFIEAGGDVFIIHPETCTNPMNTISYLKSKNMKVGVALKINEECETILHYLPLIDYIIIMGTEIGIKGVSPSSVTYEKIRFLKDIIIKENYNIELQVDGGIRKETVPRFFDSGADIVTAGSLLFENDYDEIYNWINSLSMAYVLI
jgi:ribulose-phosphate 3-epimerase